MIARTPTCGQSSVWTGLLWNDVMTNLPRSCSVRLLGASVLLLLQPTLKAMGMLASFFSPPSLSASSSCLSLLRLNEVYLPSSSLLRPLSLSQSPRVIGSERNSPGRKCSIRRFDRAMLNLALIKAVMKMAVLGSNDPSEPTRDPSCRFCPLPTSASISHTSLSLFLSL